MSEERNEVIRGKLRCIQETAALVTPAIHQQLVPAQDRLPAARTQAFISIHVIKQLSFHSFINSAVKIIPTPSTPPAPSWLTQAPSGAWSRHHHMSFISLPVQAQKQSTCFTSTSYTDPLVWLKQHKGITSSCCSHLSKHSPGLLKSILGYTQSIFHATCGLWLTYLWISIKTLTAKTNSTSYLQRTTSCHSLVCIQSCADFFAKKFTDLLFYSRDSCGTTNYLYCVNILLL